MKILILLILASTLYSAEYIIKFRDFNISDIENYKKIYSLKKHFSTSDETLLMLKERGEKYSGEELADLRTYYQGELSITNLKTLKKDSNIELIYEKPIIQKLPTTTPNYEAKQGYLLANSTNGGVDAKYAWSFQGGKAEGITVVDIEYDWILDHEDLQLQNAILYDSNGKNLTGTPIIAEANPDMADSNYHGTAVLGEIAGKNNGFGVTGLAYESEIKVVSSYTREYGFSVADAIIRSIPVLKKGSVILLEAQTTRTEDNGTGKYIPVEYYQAEFDAIKTATSNGMIIVEAGGNGDQNLDDQTLFGTKFQKNVRDSGAIIVGAGAPPSGNYGTARSKLYFSSYGSRVDVQAWGFEIYSTGYGDIFYPSSDPKRSYTKVFGGTSGARSNNNLNICSNSGKISTDSWNATKSIRYESYFK
ncbi:S8 family serine peptidase [bacterium]|nr:S8 family serine peptidase [bacterium]